MAYYDRLLHSMMEMIEGTVKIMRADGISKSAEDLRTALRAIEDAWAALAVEKVSALAATGKEREPYGVAGDMQAGE
jgi:hypothetical protein